MGECRCPRVMTLTAPCISVSTPVPRTTSETLKHKINPSAGETCPHAVDVLLYTPGEGLLASCCSLQRLGSLGLCSRPVPT